MSGRLLGIAWRMRSGTALHLRSSSSFELATFSNSALSSSRVGQSLGIMAAASRGSSAIASVTPLILSTTAANCTSNPCTSSNASR
jgi:hypothetical protein